MSSPSKRKAGLIFVFFTVLIDVLSFGVIIPVLPHLVERFVGGGVSDAAWWVGVFGVVFATIQFACSPLLGALSDRYGRRPVILLSCFGLGVDFVVMALADGLAWLMAGRIVSAVFAASAPVANAYVADVTEEKHRAQAYGLLGAAFGVGFILGPLIGGVLGDYDLRYPFWLAAALALANFLYGWLVLPESLPRERRAARIDWRQANPFLSLRFLGEQRQVLALAAIVFLHSLAQFSHHIVFVLYADYQFGWGQKQAGYVLAAVGAMAAVVSVLLVAPMVRRFGERATLMFGLACGTLGLWMLAAGDTRWFFWGMPVAALWYLALPAAQAMVSQRVDAQSQGRAQGALTGLISLAGIFAPVLYAGSFAFVTRPDSPLALPGAPYLIASALLIVAVGIAWRAIPARSKAQPALTTPSAEPAVAPAPHKVGAELS
ncbi:TCR/Tet family MFS transporter [Lysobacter enzymogenes]|uniref:TCR/Tet family MFS transporter n=1 Tax=Lysobacter enzymogenes TaxID=69 RepID=UPI001A9704C1|nr:TCR/Tet family MFS transporter [Lysobacter enzymogenes]QQP95866.1 TCR/Tet family MFS transporter [Lysobacter enzymogenes]